MYKINLDALRQVKEAYEKAGNTLEEQRDAVQAALGQITDGTWNGEDAETFKEELGSYLETVYQDDIDSMRKLASILGWGLDMAGSLKLYCERFPDVIKGGTIGMLGDSRGVSGTLYCDPDQVDRAVKASQEASENAARVSRLADEIDELLAGLKTINFGTAETDAIRASCKRIQNLEEYGAVLHTYKENVELLDGELAKQLADYVPEGIKLAGGRARSTPEGRMAADKLTGSYLKREKNTQLEKAEAILEKDADSWTEEEAAFVAEVWAACIEEQDAEGTERLLAKLVCIEYGEQTVISNGPNSTTYKRPCAVFFEQEKCQAIMNQLAPNEQGAAYYTLNRISRYSYEEDLSGQISGKQLRFAIDANVEAGVMTLEITADPQKMFGVQSQIMTVTDLNEAAGDALRQKGFTEKEIVAILRNAYLDMDVELLSALSRADTVEEYGEAFQINPNQLSVYMETGLYDYANVLMENGLHYDENGNVIAADFTAYESFLNGILSSGPSTEETGNPWSGKGLCYGGEYLAMLERQGDEQLTYLTEEIWQHYNDMEAIKMLAPEFNKQANLYALYATLCYLDRRMDEEEGKMTGARYYYQIEDLVLNGQPGRTLLEDGCFSFTQIKKREENTDDNIESEIIVIRRQQPISNEQDRRMQAIHAAEKEEEKAVQKAIWNTVGAAAGKAYPPAGIGLKVFEAVFAEGGWGDPLSGAVGILTESKGAQTASAVGKKLFDAYGDISNSRSAVEEARRLLLAAYLYDGIKVNVDQDETIHQGQYHLKTVLRQAWFSHEGLAFMTTEEERLATMNKIATDPTVTQIMSDVCFEGMDDETKRDMLSLVWCGKPIREDCGLMLQDLSSEQINECIDKLDFIYKGEKDGWYGELITYNVLKEKMYEEER